MLMRAPNRKLIVCCQFCLSGGAARFFEIDRWQRYFGTLEWPMYMMVTSGSYESSIGDFLNIWTQELKAALDQDCHDEATRTTIGDVYQRSKSSYWKENKEVKDMNEMVLSLDRDMSRE